MQRMRLHHDHLRFHHDHWRLARAAAAVLAVLAIVCLPLWSNYAAGAASSADAPSVATAEDSQRSNGELTRTQAEALVQKRYGARVVRASTADEEGRRIYVFRLLSAGGKVWTVRIDAHSGVELP